jgi:hypothetical protein
VALRPAGARAHTHGAFTSSCNTADLHASRPPPPLLPTPTPRQCGNGTLSTDTTTSTSADQCYTPAGHGNSRDGSGILEAYVCPLNTYGRGNKTYGLVDIECTKVRPHGRSRRRGCLQAGLCWHAAQNDGACAPAAPAAAHVPRPSAPFRSAPRTPTPTLRARSARPRASPTRATAGTTGRSTSATTRIGERSAFARGRQRSRRGLGAGQRARRALSSVPAPQLVAAPARCCSKPIVPSVSTPPSASSHPQERREQHQAVHLLRRLLQHLGRRQRPGRPAGRQRLVAVPRRPRLLQGRRLHPALPARLVSALCRRCGRCRLRWARAGDGLSASAVFARTAAPNDPAGAPHPPPRPAPQTLSNPSRPPPCPPRPGTRT